MSTRIAKRLLIIGWDAADWVIINQLFKLGAMPHLRRMVDTGAHGDLTTLEPKLSPLLWTSVATGKTADKHGILNFVEPDPAGEGLRLSASTTRKSKAIWNILTQSAMRVNVVSWYASHPAEPIRGTCVSNLFQESAPERTENDWPLLDGVVHPQSMRECIAGVRVHPASVPSKTLLPMVPQLAKLGRNDDRIKTLTRHVAQCMSVHNAAMAILSDDSHWDCTMVFHEAIDTIGHHFMQYHPPRMEHVSKKDHELFRNVMHGVYRLHDIMLGEMLKAAGEDTTVLLLSDHGFHSDHLRPVTANLSKQDRAAVEASWHRSVGVLALAGPGIASATAIRNAGLLDIAPTALALLGLPVGQDMDGRVLTEAFSSSPQVESIATWDEAHDEACDPAHAGMHAADMRQDPFEARDAIQQLIDLGYMAALPESATEQVEQTRLESRFNLGMVLLTTGRPAKAVGEFESLVQSKPLNARYTLALARSCLASLSPDPAAAALRAYLQHDPSNIDARTLLIASLTLMEKNDEAARLLRQLEQEVGGRPSMAHPLADLFAGLKLWDEAEQYFAKAKLHDSHSAAIHVGLARVALGRESYERAAEHCLDAIDIRYATPHAHYLLGVALAWLGELDQALQSFNLAMSLQPSHLDAHRFVAAIGRYQGRTELAAEHLANVDRFITRQVASESQRALAERESDKGASEWLEHFSQSHLERQT